jgi:hypothetical protein
MANTMVIKALVKTFIPYKGHATKFPQQTWTGKDRLDEDTHRENRRKKLCFSFKDPWELGNRCMGKGKVHYIEVLSDEEDEGQEENLYSPYEGKNNGETLHLEITEHAQLQEGLKKVTIATLSGVPRYYTFRIRGIM